MLRLHDNIISFIKWFIFSALFDEWSSEVIIRSTKVCTSVDPDNKFKSLPSVCYEHSVL